jgi:hypothetical protein
MLGGGFGVGERMMDEKEWMECTNPTPAEE